MDQIIKRWIDSPYNFSIPPYHHPGCSQRPTKSCCIADLKIESLILRYSNRLIIKLISICIKLYNLSTITPTRIIVTSFSQLNYISCPSLYLSCSKYIINMTNLWILKITIYCPVLSCINIVATLIVYLISYQEKEDTIF